MKIKTGLLIVFLFYVSIASAQELLPPTLIWKGKSSELIIDKKDVWITPAEQSDFKTTPTYDETMSWFKKLCQSPMLEMKVIGSSENGREINMIIASSDGVFDIQALKNSSKPKLLIQAGIHAGEIDGKDAGMMLLRDIAYGKKKKLLDQVIILFIPILNVDGHERSSSYNRVNQRGPENMGWRTNARNLNLNRDYGKMDTEGIRAVIGVMNSYDPQLYIDLHVTDGADYQYDITYGFMEKSVYSPSISGWLESALKPAVDKHLSDFGHIPGPLLFAANGRNFDNGNVEFQFSPRFSHAYGDARHLPSILVENHSLKPYKQRVLGTYIFLESVIHVVSKDAASLKNAIQQDTKLRPDSLIVTMTRSKKERTMSLLGVESKMEKSEVTDKEYIQWLGKPMKAEIPMIKFDQPDKVVKVPKVYWIPAMYKDVIDRLKLHGISMEIIKEPVERELVMYRISDQRFSSQPSEGHMTVRGNVKAEVHRETFYPGSARIETDQPLGMLASLLIEPQATDSFFQWGFFLEIFDRTEYAEEYVMEPLARKMLAADPALKAEFEKKKKEDAKFAENPGAMYRWFYERSPYYDKRYLLYPVGIEY